MSLKIGYYIRVSTEEQALKNEGSLDSQRHRLNSFVEIKNAQIQDWGQVIESYVDDGVSAKDTKRPALQRMLKDMKKGRINMVLVTDISRLSRSIRDFCAMYDFFKESRIKFLSLKEQFDTTTAAGEMMLFNIINLAQFERRQVSERVSLNFHSRALRGLRNGGSAPIGLCVDPTNKSVWKINENESEYVRTIFNTYISESSLFRAAEKLRALKIPTKARSCKGFDPLDCGWNTDNLHSVLRNYAYVGLREINKMNKSLDQKELEPYERYQVVKAAWPGIVDEATFFAVQKMIDENHLREKSRLETATRRVFLFSGFSVCLECGRALIGQTGHGRRTPVRYYTHAAKADHPVTCAIKRFRADENEEAVVQYLHHVLKQEGYFDGIEKTLSEIQDIDYERVVAHKRAVERSLGECDADIKNLIKIQIRTDDEELHQMYFDQLKELKDKRAELFDSLEKTSKELDEYQSPKVLRQVIEKNMEEFQRAWEKSTPSLRKRLFKTVINRLVFRDDGVDIFYHTSNQNIDHNQDKKSVGSTGNAPVDLAEVRKASALILHRQRSQIKKPLIAVGNGGSENFLSQADNARVVFLHTGVNGGQGRNRTADTRLFRALLYRLSYLAGLTTFRSRTTRINRPRT